MIEFSKTFNKVVQDNGNEFYKVAMLLTPVQVEFIKAICKEASKEAVDIGILAAASMIRKAGEINKTMDLNEIANMLEHSVKQVWEREGRSNA
jgi:hypothetical protein